MKKESKIKQVRHARRLVRTRRKILENKERIRLTVFRSNKHIYAQLIDAQKGDTLLTVNEKELAAEKLTKVQRAEKLGALLAQKAKEKKIGKVMFDKGAYRYHGRVKALAEGARKEGLNF